MQPKGLQRLSLFNVEPEFKKGWYRPRAVHAREVLQQVLERGKFVGVTIDGPHGKKA